MKRFIELAVIFIIAMVISMSCSEELDINKPDIRVDTVETIVYIIDSTIVHDSTVVYVYDSTTIVDSFYIHDSTTVYVHDTTTVYVYDSTIVYVYDSTTIVDSFYIHDSTVVYVYDSTIVYIHDSTTIVDSFYIYDSTTVYVYDSITVYVYDVDTVYLQIVDTLIDTLYLPDEYAYLEEHCILITSANYSDTIRLNNEAGWFVLGMDAFLHNPPPDSLEFSIDIELDEEDYFFDVHGKPHRWHYFGKHPQRCVYLPANALIRVKLDIPYYLQKLNGAAGCPVKYLTVCWWILIKCPELDQ